MTGKKILGLLAMEREKDDIEMVANYAKDMMNLAYQGQMQKYD